LAATSVRSSPLQYRQRPPNAGTLPLLGRAAADPLDKPPTAAPARRRDRPPLPLEAGAAVAPPVAPHPLYSRDCLLYVTATTGARQAQPALPAGNADSTRSNTRSRLLRDPCGFLSTKPKSGPLPPVWRTHRQRQTEQARLQPCARLTRPPHPPQPAPLSGIRLPCEPVRPLGPSPHEERVPRRDLPAGALLGHGVAPGRRFAGIGDLETDEDRCWGIGRDPGGSRSRASSTGCQWAWSRSWAPERFRARGRRPGWR
jgi:hypothetical protein